MICALGQTSSDELLYEDAIQLSNEEQEDKMNTSELPATLQCPHL